MRERKISPVLIRLGANAPTASAGCSKAIRRRGPAIPETPAGLAWATAREAIVQILKTLHTMHLAGAFDRRVLTGGVGDGGIPARTARSVCLRRLRVMGSRRPSATRRKPARPSASANSTAPEQ